MENAQCPPTPQMDTTAPGLRWRDVLRSVEEVAGVEPALDLAQPRMDRSRKGRAHACFALVLGHEIYIGAAGRERPGGAPIFPRPDEMATILLRALPRRLDVQHVGCRPADRVHARIETRGGTAEMHQKGGGVRRCDAFGMLDHGIDEIVADLGEVVRLPVIAPAASLTSIHHGLVLHERLALDRVGERPREALERKNRSAPIVGIAGPADGNGGDRPTVHVLRQVGHRRSPTQDQETAELIRRNSGDLPELLPDRARLSHWIDHHAAQRLRAVPARLELEWRDGPEVAAAPRKAQTRSGFSLSLARRSSPSAVTMSTDIKLSAA